MARRFYGAIVLPLLIALAHGQSTEHGLEGASPPISYDSLVSSIAEVLNVAARENFHVASFPQVVVRPRFNLGKTAGLGPSYLNNISPSNLWVIEGLGRHVYTSPDLVRSYTTSLLIVRDGDLSRVLMTYAP